MASDPGSHLSSGRWSASLRDASPPDARRQTVCFGAYRLDLETGELRRRDGAPVPLRPQATCALCLLVQRGRRLVTREELRHALWRDTVMEWEPGIHQVIRQLRRALADHARDPTYIETVPRRGYRFKAEVEVDSPDDDRPPSLPAARLSRWKPSAARDLLLFVGGLVSLPLLGVLVCIALAI